MRTNAIVVEIVRSPVAASWAAKAESGGTSSAADFCRRVGR